MDKYVSVFGGANWDYIQSDIYLKNIEVVYNDFNRYLTNVFTCITQGNLDSFRQFISKIPVQDEKRFYEYKDNLLLNSGKNFNIPQFDYALEFLYVMTQVFSGTGLKKSTKFLDLKGKYKCKFDSFRDRLSNEKVINKLNKITSTENLDFEKLINNYDGKGVFFYLDPPYYNTENYYSFHEFSKKDHERLANVVKEIEGKFMISYYDFDDLHKWFPEDKYNWKRMEFIKNAGAKKGIKNNKGEEVIIMNY